MPISSLQVITFNPNIFTTLRASVLSTKLEMKILRVSQTNEHFIIVAALTHEFGMKKKKKCGYA